MLPPIMKLEQKELEVDRWKNLWFLLAIPRHIFIGWLAIKNKWVWFLSIGQCHWTCWICNMCPILDKFLDTCRVSNASSGHWPLDKSLVQNKLTTRDRLAKQGNTSDTLCVFSRGCIESKDHLFFVCPFARRIWISC